MNEHLNPIFKEMLNNYFKGRRRSMTEDQKNTFMAVMKFVEEPTAHNINFSKIRQRLEVIVNHMEDLAIDIDLGMFDHV